MIPASFDYVRARDVAHAVSLLRDHGDDARLLAGGHSLLPALKLRLATPALLVDLRGIDEITGVHDRGDVIAIGAMTPHADLVRSAVLREAAPLFAIAGEQIADPQVRNCGTIGGSLANADPASDWPAVAIVLGAVIVAAGPDGERRIPAEDFFLGMFETALMPAEVLTGIEVPRTGLRAAYRKFRHPASGYAVVGIAAVGGLDEGRFETLRLGVTGLAPAAFRAHGVEKALIRRPDPRLHVEEAVAQIADERYVLSDGFADEGYRTALARTMAKRAIVDLLA